MFSYLFDILYYIYDHNSHTLDKKKIHVIIVLFLFVLGITIIFVFDLQEDGRKKEAVYNKIDIMVAKYV